MTPTANKLKIATRSSPLAIKQCEIIESLLPNIPTRIIKIVTKGDRVLNKSLSRIGGKGLFVKKLEMAILENKADIAIHSMKDMEWNIASGTSIGAIIKRGSRRDLLIGKWKSFDELPTGSKIGTSSVRRKAFLLSFRPDLEINLLRGNINTRLEMLNKGKYDAIVLAEAGIQRLGLKVESIRIPEKILPPSAAQGAIAIQCKSDNKYVLSLISKINNTNAEYETLAERSFVASLNGTCGSPIGASAIIKKDTLNLFGSISNQDGTVVFKENISGHYKNALSIGKELGKLLLPNVQKYGLF